MKLVDWQIPNSAFCSLYAKNELKPKMALSGLEPRPPATQVKVKMSLCLTKHHAGKTYWRIEV
jgi:hypothetical protein